VIYDDRSFFREKTSGPLPFWPNSSFKMKGLAKEEKREEKRFVRKCEN